ncbi:hypothetical protein ATP06_0237875 [Amycolatopsis regifaucium]|uniref:DUF1877 domain-containing protein n=1 Tax=Amycolatopsis regifaucium TaxID=546365 RepID=A0ABX3DGP5_9PSEU|nr:hypothetical protein ATP06_0237875 [Amycolatopsis regifaucium]
MSDCRDSAAELDKLCSFRSAPSADYLDLNWWPNTLKRTWALIGVDAQSLEVLHRGFDGVEEVNPAYRDHPNTIFEHPVTALEPDQVAEVANALRAITPERVHAAVPVQRDEAAAALGASVRDVVGDLAALLSEQHDILRNFYDEAAHRRLAMVMWWD